jgi:rSAM/selenodomain-associated transferase 1
MKHGVTLIVIAKSPQPGRVKTRLCPPCTPVEAAALAEAALADTLDVIAATPADRHVIALDGPTGPWLPRTFVVVPQVGVGLAERLANAIMHSRGPVFLVGMDTPQIDAGVVAKSLEALARHGTDAVLGPAFDGGWWGIGLRQPDARAFEGVDMSTDRTHAQQVAQLTSLGLRTHALPTLRDVDTIGDAVAVSALAPRTRFAHAVTALEPRLRERTGTP